MTFLVIQAVMNPFSKQSSIYSSHIIINRLASAHFWSSVAELTERLFKKKKLVYSKKI